MAIGTLAYERGQEAGLPIRLAQRPTILAGREGLLADLHTRLSGSPRPRLVALCGLGGTGKTSVAVEYAHRHLAEVKMCWQFSAEDPAVLTAEFAVLAAQLGAREIVDPRDPVASVHAVLARSGAEWLLIFDNAPDRASVERFVPPTGNGRVLVTTQNQHWPPDQALEVPVLPLEDASDFLVSRTDDSDPPAARELAAELGGLPLALEQAAAYMRATGTRTAAYLRLFRDRQADLLARGEAVGHPAHVATTLELALSRLAGEARQAEGLLRLLAFLAPEPVPTALLFPPDKRVASALLPDPAATVGPLLGDPVAVGDAVTALRRYSLVSFAGDAQVVMHRLVQAIIRSRLSAETAAQWENAAGFLAELAVPADPRLPAEWPAFALILPHANALLPMTSHGRRRVTEYIGFSGGYQVASDLFQLIANALTEDDAHGPGHRVTLNARHSRAYWTGEGGDAAAARDQYAALVPDREQALGAEDPETLIGRHELARWTGEAGDAASARDQYAVLLPIEERVLGRENPVVLNTRHELARWTGSAGDVAGARDQLATLLPVRERDLGPEHPETLNTAYELATWTGMAGDPYRARDRLAAVLSAEERIQGPDHPSTLLTRAELARWTREVGDIAEACEQLASLLPVSERVRGPGHPANLVIRHLLARWAEEAGDAAVARDRYAALLVIQERVCGPQDSRVLATRRCLADMTGLAGDAARAREQFNALLPACEQILGLEHPQTLQVRHGLAGWIGVTGDPAGARDQFGTLLPIRERVLGPENPETLLTRHELAGWTGAAGDAAGARDQYTVLLSIHERVLGAEHPDTQAIREELACLTE
ncbi:MAG: tetratricopeptide repeat protein [Streptosporangiaceae bacterium]